MTRDWFIFSTMKYWLNTADSPQLMEQRNFSPSFVRFYLASIKKGTCKTEANGGGKLIFNSLHFLPFALGYAKGNYLLISNDIIIGVNVYGILIVSNEFTFCSGQKVLKILHFFKPNPNNSFPSQSGKLSLCDVQRRRHIH